MEELIIDGCNLCWKAYGGSGDAEREALLRILKSYYFRKKIRVTVVFDSSEGNDVKRLLDSMKVVYAVTPADNHIVRRVRESRKPASITVISDDRQVRDRSRAHGARTMGSREFLSSWKGWNKPAAGVRDADEKPPAETAEGMKRYLDLWGE